jgi:heme-degrading monooxygenase HmoA
MLRHIVMFNYQENFSKEENDANAKKLKSDLEALAELDGVIEMKVFINELAYSTMDVMLDSLFKSEEAFNAYKVHPAHLKVVEFIGKAFKNRVAFDYFVN